MTIKKITVCFLTFVSTQILKFHIEKVASPVKYFPPGVDKKFP